jgi:hypothetical protein
MSKDILIAVVRVREHVRITTVPTVPYIRC